MTAFGQAVIDIANLPTCDQWTSSQTMRRALERVTAACIEGIHYLQGRSINRDVVARHAACHWIDRATNFVTPRHLQRREVVPGTSARERRLPTRLTARYYRLDDLSNRPILNGY
jgi:hypothetical protein